MIRRLAPEPLGWRPTTLLVVSCATYNPSATPRCSVAISTCSVGDSPAWAGRVRAPGPAIGERQRVQVRPAEGQIEDVVEHRVQCTLDVISSPVVNDGVIRRFPV